MKKTSRSPRPQGKMKKEINDVMTISFDDTYGHLRHRAARLFLLLLVTGQFIGCQMLSAGSGQKSPQPSSPNPRRVLAIWKMGERTNAAGVTETGFSGSLMFFGGADDGAIAVSGDLEVMIYEEQTTGAKPVRNFESGQGVWNRAPQDTALGKSYAVFVPHSVSNSEHYTIVVKLLDDNGQQLVASEAHL